MCKLILYNVEDTYINYLRKYERKVFSNKEECRIHERKYLGVVLNIDSFNYFVPLSSPKDTDYIEIDNVKTIRKSNIPIIRIISEDVNGNDELKGTLKFSNMIPVPDCALVDYDVTKEIDLNYQILVLKEIDFIHVNRDKIIKNANIIHNQKVKKLPNINYLKDTVDFKLLEQKCMKYAELKEIKDIKQLVSANKDIALE